VDADALKALRKELGCTAKELAQTLGIEAETVVAWEKGEAFPTKRWVEALRALEAKGPSAITRKPRGRAGTNKPPMAHLADPELWTVLRKLLVHAELRQRVIELARGYDDPIERSDG
jgi:transcriptional regulator with XRE-family HTH domain